MQTHCCSRVPAGHLGRCSICRLLVLRYDNLPPPPNTEQENPRRKTLACPLHPAASNPRALDPIPCETITPKPGNRLKRYMNPHSSKLRADNQISTNQGSTRFLWLLYRPVEGACTGSYGLPFEGSTGLDFVCPSSFMHIRYDHKSISWVLQARSIWQSSAICYRA